MRTCTKCKLEKDESGFSRKYESFQSRCKSCFAEYKRAFRLLNLEHVKAQNKAAYWKNRESKLAGMRRWHAKNKNYAHEYYMKNALRTRVRKYGITPEQYGDMLVVQSGVCALCKMPETVIVLGKVLPLAVDHDHATGRVRSLLCKFCNVMLGAAREDPDILRAAISYLESHKDASKCLA